MSDTPLLSEVLEEAIAGVLDDVRVALPGRIEAYDAETRRATVQPLVGDGYVPEDGARRFVSLPAITDVPVMFTGSGKVRIKFPVTKGDQCLLVFSSSSLARLKSSTSGQPVDPGDDRHHHIADAIAILGMFVGGGDVEDADAMIEFTATEIRAGGTEPLVTRAEFLSHTHLTAGTGPATPPTVGVTSTSSSVFPGTGKLRG